LYLTYSPFWLKWFYPTLTWHKSRKEKFVYFTFDDGPIPVVTPFVLNTLKKYNCKATFFCIGDNIAKHPSILSDVIADGHTVGNHTYNHLNGWNSSNKNYIENVLKGSKLTSTRIFRPPYGRIKKSQIKEIKKQSPSTEVIMWDVLSGDFDKRISKEQCVRNVLKHCKNGSIIVFHDSLKAFERLEYALPKVLENLSKKGFEFRTL
jgi:peptidoglycan/xylan/chitin deacetylase (PgdA/CDA1 family)